MTTMGKKTFLIILTAIVVIGVGSWWALSGQKSPTVETTRATVNTAEPQKKMLLSLIPTVSGSLNEARATGVAANDFIELENIGDFKVGQGIAIAGASDLPLYNQWLVSVITAIEGNKVYLRDAVVISVTNARVVHDDSDAVNAVLASAEDTVFFDVPNLYVHGLRVKSNTTVKGIGTTVLMAPPYVPESNRIDIMMSVEDADQVRISGLTFDGGKDRGVLGDDIYGVCLLFISRTTNVFIESNTFRNNYYASVIARGDNSDLTISTNTIRDTDVGILAFPDYEKSMVVRNLLIENNDIQGGTSEGISIESGMYDYTQSVMENLIIRGNRIDDKMLSSGIFYGSLSRNVLIENNIISRTGIGISSRDGNLEPLEALTAENVQILNNQISDTKYDGMILEGTDVLAKGNQLSNMVTAIMIRDNPYMETGIQLEDNTFVNVEQEEYRQSVTK